MMTDREKLLALMDQFAGGSQQVFAQLIGVPRPSVATWLHRGAITANGREAILDAFPQVSREWLVPPRVPEGAAVAGLGLRAGRRHEPQMLSAEPDTIYFSPRDLTPYFEDSRATCGVAEQFARPELASGHIHVPGVRAHAALKAEGDSMEPTIHAGDICLIGDPVGLGDVSPRRIYLVVTAQGQCMFKRIYDEGPRARGILVLSENPSYVPHAQGVLKSEVLRVYPLLYVLHRV